MNIKPLSDFTRVVVVDVFENEILKLYSKSFDEMRKYLEFLYSELHKIENRNEKINRAEPITYKGVNLYSIRKRMKKNTRVLYYYMKNGKIILLTAFDEKNSSDYDNAKERAYNRLKKLNLI